MTSISPTTLWLCHFALGSFLILAGGACLVLCRRQPADRVRAVRTTFAACLILPALLAIPNLPRLSLGWFRTAVDVDATSGADARGHFAGQSASLATTATPSEGALGVASNPRVVNTLEKPVDLDPAKNAWASSPNAAVIAATNSVSATAAKSAPRDASNGPIVSLSFSFLVCAAFVLIACAIAVRWLRGLARLSRLYADSDAAPPWMRDELSKVAGNPVDRVNVRISSQVDAPLTWGVLRPVILVPAGMADRRSAALRYALAHEWSHVQRRDAAAVLLAAGLQVILYFQPLYWWLRRQMLLCQDYLADAKAAEFAESADEYASFLLSLARRRAAVPPLAALGMADRRSRLFHRVSMLCESAVALRPNSGRTWNWFAAAASLLLLAAVSSLTLQADEESLRKAPAEQLVDASQQPEQEPESEKAELPDPITYEGVVVNRANGEPIEGATVIVEHELSRDPQTGEWITLQTTEHKTDADGKYSFTLPPEEVAEPSLYIAVDTRHPKFAPQGKGGYAHSMIRKNLEMGEAPFYSRIELSPGEPVTGTVIDPEGNPLAGAKVRSYSKTANAPQFEFGFGSFQETLTDENGRFELVIHTPGDGVLWLEHDDYAIEAHRLADRRGEWGELHLEDGNPVIGTLLSAVGEPVSGVELELRRNGDGEDADQFLNQNAVAGGIRRAATSEQDGAFSFAPLPSGTYRLAVRQSRQIGSDHVFLPMQIEIVAGEAPDPITWRADPPVYVRATYLDSKGEPRSGHEVHLFGRMNGEYFFARSTRPGDDGKLQLTVPHGLEEVEVRLTTNEHSALRWRMSHDEPLQNEHEIKLDTLNQDVEGIEIIRYVAPLLLVKAVDENGEPLDEFKPKLDYEEDSPKDPNSRFISGVNGHVNFEQQQDGRWRSSQLLPNQPFELSAELEGYAAEPQSMSLEEGDEREVVFVMKRKD